jgi:hypothetical protein
LFIFGCCETPAKIFSLRRREALWVSAKAQATALSAAEAAAAVKLTEVEHAAAMAELRASHAAELAAVETGRQQEILLGKQNVLLEKIQWLEVALAESRATGRWATFGEGARSQRHVAGREERRVERYTRG